MDRNNSGELKQHLWGVAAHWQIQRRSSKV